MGHTGMLPHDFEVLPHLADYYSMVVSIFFSIITIKSRYNPIYIYIHPNVLLEPTNVVHDFLHPLSARELPQGLRAQDRHLRQRRQPRQRHQLRHRRHQRHHLRCHLSSRSGWDWHRMTSAIAATSRCNTSIQSSQSHTLGTCLSLPLQAAQVWHVPSTAWQALVSRA